MLWTELCCAVGMAGTLCILRQTDSSQLACSDPGNRCLSKRVEKVNARWPLETHLLGGSLCHTGCQLDNPSRQRQASNVARPHRVTQSMQVCVGHGSRRCFAVSPMILQRSCVTENVQVCKLHKRASVYAQTCQKPPQLGVRRDASIKEKDRA